MKLPLAFSLKNRASSLNQDAKLLNGYVETRGDPKKGGLTTVEKRPAIDSAFELTSGSGQGLYVPNTPEGDGEPGVIIGDILTRAPTPKTKRLLFGTQPSGVVLNTAFTVTVTIRNSVGDIVNSSANVTVALSNNPTSATLGGTLTKAAVAGTATFNDLTMNRSGENFTIIATSSGLNSATSNEFDIATHLTFTTQPGNTTPNTDFTVVVTAQDTASNTDTNYTGTVTLSLWSAIGNGIPTGDFIVDAVAGVATFANISLSDSGISGNADGTYQFVARADQQSFVNYYIPAAAVSNSFSITAATHSLVAGYLSGLPDQEEYGFNASIPGSSLTPSTYLGETISTLLTLFDYDSGINQTRLIINQNVAQGFFTSLQIGSTTVLASAAVFHSGGGLSIWDWIGTEAITTTGTYPVTFS